MAAGSGLLKAKGLDSSATSGTSIAIPNLSDNLDRDTEALARYNNLLMAGFTPAESYAKALTRVSQSAKDAARQSGQLPVDIDKYRESQTQAATATKLSTGSMIAQSVASAALTGAISMGVTLAVNGLIMGLDYLIHYEDKLAEETQQAKQEYDELVSEIENIHGELESTSTRMDELGQKGTLTIYEQEEYDRLKHINDELRTQLQITQDLANVKQNETDEKANKQFNRNNNAVPYESLVADRIKNINGLTTQEKDLEQKLKKLEGSDDKSEYQGVKNQLEQARASKEALQANLRSIIEELQGFYTNMSDSNPNKKIISGIFKDYTNFLNQSKPLKDKFNDVFNSSENTGVRDQLLEAAAQGKDVEAVLDRIASSRLKDALADAGISTADMAKQFYELAQQGDTAEAAFLVFGSTMSNVTDEGLRSFGEQVYERMESAKEQFEDGKISAEDYFNSLNSELENVDFSEYTDNLEEAQGMQAALFTSTAQEAAQGLSDLMADFEANQIDISDYLDGFTSIAELVSSLSDTVMENGEAWLESGSMTEESISAMQGAQTAIADGCAMVEQYKDSIYSLQMMTSGSLQMGSAEFNQHAAIVAEDLAYIVSSNGEMADQIRNTMGSTSEEIAASLTNNVSNQGIATQAIAANTNKGISSMAGGVATLFQQLGDIISNFKIDLRLSVKKFKLERPDGCLIPLPQADFSLEATESTAATMKSIGSAISNFGNDLQANIEATQITTEDFKIKTTGKGNSSGFKKTNDGNSNGMQKSGGNGSGSTAYKNEALDNELKRIEHLKAIGKYENDELGYIKALENAKSRLTKKESERWQLEEKIYAAREAYEKQQLDDYLDEISYKEAMGQYDDDQARKIADLTYAYNKLAKKKEDLRKLEQQIYKETKAYQEAEAKKAKDAADAIEDIVDMRMKYIRKEQELKKKALEDELDGYKKLYDAQAKALDKQKEADDYAKTAAKKRADIAEIETRLNELSADTSAASQREQAELRAELAEKQEDLEEYEKEQSIERQKEKLDEEYALLEEQNNAKIEKIDEFLDNEGAVRDQAMADIMTRSETVYQELMEWNAKYGDGINKTVTDAWKAATDALKTYGTQANAIKISENPGDIKPPVKTPSAAAQQKPAASSGGSSAAKAPVKGGRASVTTKDAAAYASSSGKRVGSWSTMAKNAGVGWNQKLYVTNIANGKVAIGTTSKIGNTIAWVDKKNVKGYRSGSPFIPSDQLALVDEAGPELIIRNPVQGRLTHLSRGDGVLNSTLTERIIALAQNPAAFLNQSMAKLSSAFGAGFAPGAAPCIQIDSKVIVEGNADMETVKALEKAENRIAEKVFTQANKKYLRSGHTINPKHLG
nr:MAG TPA: MAEBL protein [Caudoviricetes sp.]